MENKKINSDRRGGDGYRIPFGIHKGKSIDTVPTNYLRWLITQEWLADHCRFEVFDELGKRGAQFSEGVMQIVGLKAEIHSLRTQLEEAEQRNHRADLDLAPADDEFASELKRSADSA